MLGRASIRTCEPKKSQITKRWKKGQVRENRRLLVGSNIIHVKHQHYEGWLNYIRITLEALGSAITPDLATLCHARPATKEPKNKRSDASNAQCNKHVAMDDFGCVLPTFADEY